MYMATIPQYKRDEDDDEDISTPMNTYEGEKPNGTVSFEDLFNMLG